LNLFLALLLSSFSSENIKKGQQQDEDTDAGEEEEKAKMRDNQMAAAYERLQRWVKYVTVRLRSLMRPHTATDEHCGGGLKATSTTDTAYDLTSPSDDMSASVQSPQPVPALLVDCTDRQVYDNYPSAVD